MMKRRVLALFLFVALLLTGCGKRPADAPSPGEELVQETPAEPPAEPEETIGVEDLLADIYGAAPGTAGSSLKAAYVAGEFLDWSHQPDLASGDAVRQWVEENVPAENALELALSWNEVLTQADALMRGEKTAMGCLSDAGYTMRLESYDAGLVNQAALILSPLFIQLLDRTERTLYRNEAPGDYDAVKEAAFEGVWVDNAAGTLLIFSRDTCRVVYPALEWFGEAAYAFRIRDRSDMGYCPALEIDFRQSGNFDAPLTYYVSGIDETHFWSSTTAEQFYRLA